MYKKCLLAGAFSATLVLGGCAQIESQWNDFNEWFQPTEAISSVIKPYRPDTHQGNLVTKEMVDQLHLGMTQLQVQFLLGVPLLRDMFHQNRWDYLYYMNNGTSNSFVLGLSLSRNSIDNPIYTRSGSQFSLDLSITPPVSLFRDKNWQALYEQSQRGSQAAKKEMYSWIEYWKLKFKARTYTPLTDPTGKWTLVLMTRADIGLLGSYNKYLKSPFETFYVGGDGMSGSNGYAQETIALRGYGNGAFTPWRKDGYAYTRFCLELHFPFMLQPSTTIYGLAFLEGGNAWTDVKDFSPFNLKRSAGAGVRIYLPMVGMMGIDWAYGFDTVFGEKGGSHFHFILGQEF